MACWTSGGGAGSTGFAGGAGGLAACSPCEGLSKTYLPEPPGPDLSLLTFMHQPPIPRRRSPVPRAYRAPDIHALSELPTGGDDLLSQMPCKSRRLPPN